jgi:hypothetical protein
MNQPKQKIPIFIVTGDFDFQGKHYLPGDSFDVPANYVLVPHNPRERPDHPEDRWNGERFHVPASDDGVIVLDDYAPGGLPGGARYEVLPSHPEHDEIMPLRINLEGASS